MTDRPLIRISEALPEIRRTLGVIDRDTVVAWVQSGELVGRKIGGRWFVERASLDRLLGSAAANVDVDQVFTLAAGAKR